MKEYFVNVKETAIVLKKVKASDIDEAIYKQSNGEVIAKEVIDSDVLETAPITNLEMKKGFVN